MQVQNDFFVHIFGLAQALHIDKNSDT